MSSFQLNDDGMTWVYIPDVPFFMKPNTALDRDARKRTASVYLARMLPPILSGQLYILLSRQDRLAFSIIFTMDADAKVQRKWYGKTMIRSSAKLVYYNAQRVIDTLQHPNTRINSALPAEAHRQYLNALIQQRTILLASSNTNDKNVYNELLPLKGKIQIPRRQDVSSLHQDCVTDKHSSDKPFFF